jgi:tetratricopeptide (TPR) repeat protein
VKFAEARTSCELLLKQGDLDRAIWVFGRALPTIRTDDEWKDALELIERIPEEYRVASVEAATIYVRVLNGNRRFDNVIKFSARLATQHNQAQIALVQLELAGAMIDSNRSQEARHVLENAFPYLHGEPLGIAFRRFGLVLFTQGEVWREAFGRAKGLLSGNQLGYALLNEGYCLSESGQSAEARNVWLEALPLFRSHPKMLAWVRYNLGISALSDLDPEAERHFLEAERLTRKPQAAALRAPTLNGLAGSRRVLGEWFRAEFAYRVGLEAARDAHDLTESYLGLARTLRLAGRHTEALETLEFALSEPELEHDLFHVARAKNYLALGQPAKARASLERVGELVSEYDKWLERIARAELARQDQHFDEAINLLEGLPVTTLHAREEVRQWPELFALLRAVGKPVPEPLEYIKTTVVRVTANGILRVTVNARAVTIPPVGRTGELLVFLLEQGGAASLEVIRDAFFPDAQDEDVRRANKTIWFHAESLRKALGWASSVIALRGAYQLDPDVIWQYDIAEARAQGAFRGEFLKGVYSDWVLEVGRELEALSGQNTDTFLN